MIAFKDKYIYSVREIKYTCFSIKWNLTVPNITIVKKKIVNLNNLYPIYDVVRLKISTRTFPFDVEFAACTVMIYLTSYFKHICIHWAQHEHERRHTRKMLRIQLSWNAITSFEHPPLDLESKTLCPRTWQKLSSFSTCMIKRCL